MIWSLAREQVRAQRRYIVWASAVVALAVAVASYGALVATSLNAASDEMGRTLVLDTDTVSIGVAVNGPSAFDNSIGVDIPTASSTEVVDAVRQAQADGNRVAAQATYYALVIPSDAGGGEASSIIGDVDWDALLLEGTAPTSGEVALSAAYADRLNLGIGDSVDLYATNTETPLGMTARVSGVTVSSFDTAGLSMWGYSDVWVAWGDIPAYTDALAKGSENILGAAPNVQLNWDGPSSTLEHVFGPGLPIEAPFDAGENATVVWVSLGVVVLVIGAIAMAFAFGRAQAQSRTQWVATARALGATRRHVVLATLAEAGVLAGVGLLAGYALGFVGATAHLRFVHSVVPGAAISRVPASLALVALGALLLSIVVSLVIAAVPAFWATRVSPAAALKPENDITNAEVGRRVKFWPVALLWAASGIVAAVSADPRSEFGASLYGVILWWMFLGLTLVVANEALRWLMPALGRWLSRRPEKSALVAGDSILARPRQFTVPAFLVALGTGALLAAALVTMFQQIAGYAEPDSPLQFSNYFGLVWQTWIAPATVIVVGALTLLATIISAATATVTARERATREALGVTTNQTRIAGGVAQMFTLLVGVCVGVVLAIIVVAVNSAYSSLHFWDVEMAKYVAIAATARAAATVLAVGLICAALSALVIAAVARTPSLTPRAAEASRR